MRRSDRGLDSSGIENGVLCLVRFRPGTRRSVPLAQSEASKMSYTGLVKCCDFALEFQAFPNNLWTRDPGSAQRTRLDACGCSSLRNGGLYRTPLTWQRPKLVTAATRYAPENMPDALKLCGRWWKKEDGRKAAEKNRLPMHGPPGDRALESEKAVTLDLTF